MQPSPAHWVSCLYEAFLLLPTSLEYSLESGYESFISFIPDTQRPLIWANSWTGLRILRRSRRSPSADKLLAMPRCQLAHRLRVRQSAAVPVDLGQETCVARSLCCWLAWCSGSFGSAHSPHIVFEAKRNWCMTHTAIKKI